MFCCLKEYGKSCCRYLYVLDFDDTIINGNADSEIMKLLNGPIPPEVKAVFNGNNWSVYMRKVYEHLYDSGVTTKDMLECVKKIPLTEGMERFLRRVEKSCRPGRNPAKANHWIILSDSNDLLIRTYLNNLDPPLRPNAIISNYGDVSPEDGRLRLRPHHVQRSCEICPPNLCKGQALQTYIRKFGPFHRVAFIGDGGNDICPANRLTSADIVFVRKWYRMHKAILRGTYRTQSINLRALTIYYYEGDELEYKLFCAACLCQWCSK